MEWECWKFRRKPGKTNQKRKKGKKEKRICQLSVVRCQMSVTAVNAHCIALRTEKPKLKPKIRYSYGGFGTQ